MNEEPRLDTHKCPTPNCDLQVPRRYLFCQRHWGLLPKAVQHETICTWHSYNRGEGMAAYLAAREKAIELLSRAVPAISFGEFPRVK